LLDLIERHAQQLVHFNFSLEFVRILLDDALVLHNLLQLQFQVLFHRHVFRGQHLQRRLGNKRGNVLNLLLFNLVFGCFAFEVVNSLRAERIKSKLAAPEFFDLLMRLLVIVAQRNRPIVLLSNVHDPHVKSVARTELTLHKIASNRLVMQVFIGGGPVNHGVRCLHGVGIGMGASRRASLRR